MFDAGAIEARLTVNLAEFDRDMAKAEARVKKFEDTPHKVKLAAELDNGSITRAHKLFTDLDNQLSREAMQRLRASPQGSVLGALNALFSPHPVTGGPTPGQAATNGLLGRMIAAPGGGGPSTIAGASQDARRGTSVVGTVLGINDAQVKTDAAKAGRDAADAASTAAADEAKRRGNGWFAGLLGGISGAVTGVFNRRGGSGNAGTSLAGSTAGFAGNLAGGIGPGITGVSTKAASIIGLGGSLLGALPALFGGVAPLLPATVGAGALGLLFKGAQSQISPVSQGISQAQQALATAQATPNNAAGIKTAQAALAAANAQLGTLSPGLQSIYQSEKQIGNWWQGFTSTFAPMFAGPLSAVAGLLKSLTGPLTNFFSQAFKLATPLIGGLGDIVKDVLPGLAQGFAAAAPVIRPLLDGIGALVGNLLPGLNTLIKASAPAVKTLAQIFGTLGSDLGSMLAIFAPVLKQSSIILKALFDVVGALLPIIGKLASIFAVALAPVFLQFAQIIKALLPFLTLVGNILASLAGAVIADLVGAFGALAQLLKAIAPSLNTFAKALSGVFVLLENTGVFAILGNALEDIVAPLGKLINALLKGLTPLLPPIIGFIAQLSTQLATALATALVGVLPALTNLATVVLKALAQVLPVVLPLLTQFATVFTNQLATVIASIGQGLAVVIGAIPPQALTAIAGGILAIVAGLKLWQLGTIAVGAATKVLAAVNAILATSIDFETIALKAMYAWDILVAVAEKAWTVIQAALDIALAASPIVLIGLAIAALGVGIYELYQHWNTVWGFIKRIAEDAWNFIYNGWGKYLLPLLGPAGLLALGVIEVYQHWNQIWGFIKNVAQGAWNFIWNGFGKYLLPLLGPAGLIALGAIEVYQHWNTIWGLIKTVVSDFWQYIWTDFGAKISNFLINTLPGWFQTAVNNIGKFWNDIQNVVETPVKFVIDDVLDGIISAFDTITNAVGLGNPIPVVHPFGLAGGGRVPGFGGGDRWPALLEGGEAVIDKHRTREWAWLFKLMGVPGFASGGVAGAAAPASGGGGGLSGLLGGLFNLIDGIFTGNTSLIGSGTLSLAGIVNAFSSVLSGGTGGAKGVLGSILEAIPKKAIHGISGWLFGKVSAMAPGATGSGHGVPSLPGGSASSGYAAFVEIAKALGWGAALLQDWVNVEMAEAGFSLTATNPSSGAYGMAQFINGAGEYYTWGGDPYTYLGQAKAMANYIISRYGNPAGAWAHEQADHWYGNGGLISEPVLGYGLNTGQRYVLGEKGPEVVTPLGMGRGGMSKLADILNIMLPEGASLTAAMNELDFRMHVAQMQGFLATPGVP